MESRVDNIIAHNNDTEGNSELIDIRTDVSGIVHETAGSAVRNQAGKTNEKISCLNLVTGITQPVLSWSHGHYIAPNGSIYDVETMSVSQVRQVPDMLMIKGNTFVARHDFSPLVTFYNSMTTTDNTTKKGNYFINGDASTYIDADFTIIPIPDGTVSYRISQAKQIVQQSDAFKVYEINGKIDKIPDLIDCVASIQNALIHTQSTISEQSSAIIKIKDGSGINNHSIDILKLKNIQLKENLIDSEHISNSVLDQNGNIISSSEMKLASDIDVTPGTRYYRKNYQTIALVGLYDSQGNWLSRTYIEAGINYFDVPENVYCISLNEYNVAMSTQVFGCIFTDETIPFNTQEYNIFENDFYKEINKLNHYSNLYQKRILIMGDSIAAGHVASNLSKTSWWTELQKKGYCEITNIAVAGSCLQYTTDRDSEFSSAYTLSSVTDFQNYDMVIILSGTNDILYNIGEPSDNTPTTACGALRLIINNILTSNPDINIVYFSHMFRSRFSQGDNKNSDEYSWAGKYVVDLADKLVETSEKCHIPSKNLYRTFLLNKWNSDELLSDGLHPSDKGYHKLASAIAGFIHNNVSAQ